VLRLTVRRNRNLPCRMLSVGERVSTVVIGVARGLG